MSLNNFAKLFEKLDSNNSNNQKINFLIEFFEKNCKNSNIWTIYLLVGKGNKRFITGKSLRQIYTEIYDFPIWLMEKCYLKVGDSAEVISLLLKDIKYKKHNLYRDISLNELIENTLPKIAEEDYAQKKSTLKQIWKYIPKDNHLVFNKILTGSFRIGVSKGLITKALAKMVGIEESFISHRLMGNVEPTLKNYNFLISKNINLKELNSKPYPFQLANSFEEKLKLKSKTSEYQFEWKWDGIRSQIIKRSENISIWTRGEELVNNSFPDFIPLISSIKDDFVLDGEILVWDKARSIPKNFSYLQKRIGRKSPSLKIQKDLPVIFMIYDLLELNNLDLRSRPLYERRKLLENIFSHWEILNKNHFENRFKITNLHKIKSWEEVEDLKNNSRQHNTEGLVIKYKNSTYQEGRKKGHWWKYKVDPMQLDGVLIYAKSGNGKRADLYTDYSFALWNDNKLVKFASAYTGLNNEEIKELDRWIRQNTVERYGPVRSVKPEMVFEISFENIQISKRHKSGIAVRFPRISKWRKDKKIFDADTLQSAQNLLKINHE